MSTRPTDSTGLASSDAELHFLQEAAMRLSERESTQDILHEAIHSVAGLLKSDSSIYLLEGNTLTLATRLGFRGEAASVVRIKPAHLEQHRLPVAIASRAHEDARFKPFKEFFQGHCEAFLSIPLVGGGRLLGFITAHSPVPRDHDENDIRIIETIGFLLGTRLETVRLQQENHFLIEKMNTRALIERANTILQKNLGINEQEAYRKMQLESQRRNKRMNEIAEAIILGSELRQPGQQYSGGPVAPLLNRFADADTRNPKVEFDSLA